jgi:hypothetical protein
MTLGGHHYEDGEARRRIIQIRTAVARLPLEAPLRPYFEFLLDYIDELDGELDEASADQSLLEKLQTVGDRSNYGELLAVAI